MNCGIHQTKENPRVAGFAWDGGQMSGFDGAKNNNQH